MEHTTMTSRIRATALILAAAPIFAACSGMVDNETIGTAPTTTSASNGTVNFIRYAALGTSVSMGLQSAGVNDSTQREAFPYQLAQAMGLTPGVNWFYPSLAYPGCPAPYTNPLTGSRVNGVSGTACAYRTPGSAHPFMNNVGVNAVRVVQALDITRLDYPVSDTVGILAQFVTGSMNPIDMATEQNPTFITVELGANDLLRVATYGDANLMTSTDSFQAQYTRLADRLDATGAAIAISNVPDVTAAPFTSRGFMFFCLKNGCPAFGINATPPYSLASFLPAANCAPSPALGGPVGGVGDSTLVSFPTTGGITKVLAGGGAVQLDCAAGTVLINIGAGFVTPPAALFPVLTITAAEFSAAQARRIAFNTFLQSLAQTRGYAYANIDSTLRTLSADPTKVPPFPNFANPSALFGTYFSLDGFHPSKAGQRLVALTFANAINAKFGTTLTIP